MILVVGAGPIGIEMAIELSRRNVPFRIVEAGSTASTIEWYAPGTEIFSSPERIAIADIPFEPQTRKAFREDYLVYLRNVVRQFKLPIEHYRRVVRIEKSTADNFKVAIAPSSHGVGGPLEEAETPESFSDIETLEVEKIILAIGNLHVPQLSNVPGEDSTWVSHYMSEPHRYSGTRVTIVGSGNSAAEAAIRLYHVGAFVTLCHRNEGFRPKRIKPWLLPELENLIKEGKIQVVTNFQLKEITRSFTMGSNDREIVSIASDFVLLLTGYRQKTDLFDQLGVTLVDAQPIVDLNTMETNVPNVYVIGTAAAGTESGGVKTFIENAHVHVNRVLHALKLIERAHITLDRPVDEREI
ncbi:MAG: NAD(P)-binding domain-containing protein [Candidatus Obscuribacterales bacterium]|nr:NAD(P)-binding domain-containing protein [Candidatus Obscuribacterales bacterium]